MQNGRLKAEQEARDLTETANSLSARIKTMISDYEKMKSELMESNAIKDQYIESLNRQITKLSNNLTKQDESLAEKDFTFDFEKRRLTNALTDRENQMKQMEIQIETLQNELKIKSAQFDELNFNQKVALDKISTL